MNIKSRLLERLENDIEFREWLIWSWYAVYKDINESNNKYEYWYDKMEMFYDMSR